MIKGDYQKRVDKKKKDKNGNPITEKVVTSTTRQEYVIGPRLGKGGVGCVYRARKADGTQVAFKEFAPSKKHAVIHRNIKGNIRQLIKKPIVDNNGNELPCFVKPQDLVELPASKGFGYIMDLVDMKTYLPLQKLWHKEVYPDALMLCKIGMAVSSFFQTLHGGSGWCYKDINKENILINPKTGDIRIIDCDNISTANVRTIFGTPFYLAPEVYTTSTPTSRSDQYSMAVYFYFLLIGGYPLDGKRTEEYMLKNSKTVFEVADYIYGTNALFAFDPKDTSNSIRPLAKQNKMYAIQVARWDALPPALQQCFVDTFSVGLKHTSCSRRTSDKAWFNAFSKLKDNGIKKCRCGKHYFISYTADKTCEYCNCKLPKERKPVPVEPVQSKRVPVKPVPPKPVQSKRVPVKPVPPKPVPPATTHRVVFLAKRDVTPSVITVPALVAEEISFSALYPKASNTKLMKVMYHQARQCIGVKNLSGYTWRVFDNGVTTPCAPNGIVALKVGMVITVLDPKLVLKIKSLQ